MPEPARANGDGPQRPMPGSASSARGARAQSLGAGATGHGSAHTFTLEEWLRSIHQAEQLLASVRWSMQDYCSLGNEIPVFPGNDVSSCYTQAAPPSSTTRKPTLSTQGVSRLPSRGRRLRADQRGPREQPEQENPERAPEEQGQLESHSWLRGATSDVVDQVMVDADQTGVETQGLVPNDGSKEDDDSWEDQKELTPGASGTWRRFRPIIHPESFGRLIWLMIGLVFILFEVFAIPVTIAFNIQAEGALLGVISFMNGYFLLDIVATFFTGFVDASGNVVMSVEKSATRYLSGWFLIDAAASIPWEWLNSNDTRGVEGVRLIRGFRLLRLARILRLLNQKHLSEKVELLIETNRTFVFLAGMGKVLFLLFGVTHWMACAWYVIGTQDPDPGDTTWVDKYLSPRWDEDHKLQRYIYSLFFCLTTMTTVGYGSPAPENYDEVCFTLVLLLVASLVFALLAGVLTDLIRSHNNEANLKNERKVVLSRYMRWRAVPRDLFMMVRQHVLFLWDANEGYESYEEDLKAELPPHLRTELCFHIYGRVLQAVPFLMWLQDYSVCLKELSTRVQSIFLSKGDLLFRIGQPNEQIYVLLSGSVWLTRNENLVEQAMSLAASQPMDIKPLLGSKRVRRLLSIPRNKEAGMLDMWSMLLEKTKTLQQNATQHVTGTVIGKLASQQSERDITDELHALKSRRKKRYDDVFDSEILRKASLQLRLRDVRERRAALAIQTIWRQKKQRLLHSASTGSKSSSNRASTKRLANSMTSKTVEAPAYFGESCLWVPLEQWGKVDPPQYLYTARCEQRGELVYVSRDVIHDIVVRFSPWLGERFECFRKAVVGGIDALASGAAARSGGGAPPDWAAADLALEGPEDAEEGGALTAARCQRLVAAGTSLPERLQDRGLPAMPRVRSQTFNDAPPGRALSRRGAGLR